MATVPTAPLEGVKNIAVLRANAIGDYILTLPALAALRAAYPLARICLLGRPWHQEFLIGRDDAPDEVLVAPLTEADRQQDFFSRMRQRGFDLVLQLHGGGQFANPFVSQIGARVTAGFTSPDAQRLDLNLRYQPMQPVILHLLECVGLVGAESVDLIPKLKVTAQDRAMADRVLPRSEQNLVLLQPGASDPRRRWPITRYARLGDALAARGATIVVQGSANESATVDAVAQRMRQPCIRLAGQLNPGGLAGLLARCRLVIGNDTGPLHLARAVGTSTITIIWVGNLHPFGPLASLRDRVLISWQLQCPICGETNVDTRCIHDVSFVDAVEVDDVHAAALELIDAVDPR